MRYLSLFSGIEAATQAWEPLGWECVGVSEIEPFPCAVLEHHYPDIPNLGDVTKITEERLKELGQIDLVIFGSPCQNLSVAGNRKGLQGEQSSLFYAAMEIVKYARKNNGLRFALWENVPGSFSSNGGEDFSKVVEQMAGLQDIGVPKNGWGNEGAAVGSNGLLEWSVLDAQWFGVAQRRRRVFAVIDFGEWQNRKPILLEQESLRGDIKASKKERASYTRRNRKGFRLGGYAEYLHTDVAGTLSTANSLMNIVTEKYDKDGSDSDLRARALTPLEYERLQGFPDNYTQIPYKNKHREECPKTPRYKALGNSMAVPVIRWIGESINRALGEGNAA